MPPQSAPTRMDRIARLETFARAGYLARGVVYLLLGYLALSSGDSQGTGDVFRRIQDIPGGTVALVLVALGLACYGLFRIYGGVLDLDGKGNEARGKFERAGQVASGVGHVVLCIVALRLALGSGGSGGGSGLPGGNVVAIILGLLVIVAGLGNFLEAYRASFRQRLDAKAPDWTHYAGRAGYAARGLVFVLIGWQLLALAFVGGGQRPDTESALQALGENSWLFTAVALGLLLFGLFSLIMAAYARIRDENVLHRLKAEVARRT